MGVMFSEEHGPLADCSNWLAVQGKPYPRTCRRCGLGVCKSIINAAMDSPREETPVAVPAKPPAVKPLVWREIKTHGGPALLAKTVGFERTIQTLGMFEHRIAERQNEAQLEFARHVQVTLIEWGITPAPQPSNPELEAPYSMNTAPLTADELARAKALPEASQLLFDSAPADWTIGRLRHEVRLLIDPPSLADQLEDVRVRQIGALGPSDSHVVAEAVTALWRMSLVCDLRPIKDLRQEAFRRFGRSGDQSHPNRWVMLWCKSGYHGPVMDGRVGRLQPDGQKFAGQFVGRDYEQLSAAGLTPTHFSEIPLAAFDVPADDATV